MATGMKAQRAWVDPDLCDGCEECLFACLDGTLVVVQKTEEARGDLQ